MQRQARGGQQRAFVQCPDMKLQWLIPEWTALNVMISSDAGMILQLRACARYSSSCKEPYEADQCCVTVWYVTSQQLTPLYRDTRK
jgi:hypothetical protein